MKKSELVDALAGASGQAKGAVESVLDALPDVMLSALASGAVVLPGIAKFDARHREARNVRNPATGAAMVSPAKTVPSIKPVKPFKDAIATLSR